MDIINNFFAELSNFLWGNFGVANLVIGGGVFFLIYSKLTPFRYFKHAFEILLGKHDDPDDEGQISHFQALSTAIKHCWYWKHSRSSCSDIIGGSRSIILDVD